MAGKGSDRKAKLKDLKGIAESNDTAAFTLPDSLPCSEVDFPILIKRKPRANWNDIIDESNKWHNELDEFNQSKLVPVPKSPFLSKFANKYLLLTICPDMLHAFSTYLRRETCSIRSLKTVP